MERVDAGAAALPLCIRLERNGIRIHLDAELPAELPPDNSGQLAACFFSDLERRAVNSINGEPLQAKEIARKLGLSSPTTQLKLALRVLVERGVLTHAPDGYRVANAVFAAIAAGNS